LIPDANRAKPMERSFTEPLDRKNANTIICRFVLSEDYARLEAFSIPLLCMIATNRTEIIRFDCSSREKINVHRLYARPPTKQYLAGEKTFETLEEFAENIRRNWNRYLLSYMENYDITENVI